MSEEFEFSWDFGTENKLKDEVSKLQSEVKVLSKELDLRHKWVKHHQKSVELSFARECLTKAKFDVAVEELEKLNPVRASEIKKLVT